ncbi:SDR family NAD(P)-dependent oxidoreductase [Epidermidibacterium keratini]|uniref:SDR family NAD(P)-dependent oxidoreductase n=1 Tax=Epidermidibacterium keratini TaxID=1891644 RepID=A0A7L4YQ26_9ACTN|nr:SDR family oxidoreductase [Epidermidibacterium keratini]QHC00899.1 SDR family NAD(P)-dependent oxidoreductase [Epidermidibacterium keratini]
MLQGRTALVTGAGNGIGRAVSLDLARHGVRVIGTGRTDESLQQTREILLREGLDMDIRVCDGASAVEVETLRHDLANERVSILVNNAGVAGPVAALTEVEVEDWDATFANNVRAVFLMCKAFIPGMVANRLGDVVNIASVSGKRPLPNRTPYCASKMAVIGLSTTLAWEVGEFGVKVNSLSPGPVDGPRIRSVLSAAAERTGGSYEDAAESFLSRTAMHRMLSEEEVAAGVRMVIETDGLTAADLDLSAGMVAR